MANSVSDMQTDDSFPVAGASRRPEIATVLMSCLDEKSPQIVGLGPPMRCAERIRLPSKQEPPFHSRNQPCLMSETFTIDFYRSTKL